MPGRDVSAIITQQKIHNPYSRIDSVKVMKMSVEHAYSSVLKPKIITLFLPSFLAW